MNPHRIKAKVLAALQIPLSQGWPVCFPITDILDAKYLFPLLTLIILGKQIGNQVVDPKTQKGIPFRSDNPPPIVFSTLKNPVALNFLPVHPPNLSIPVDSRFPAIAGNDPATAPARAVEAVRLTKLRLFMCSWN
jgi:hypothetical protein